MTLPGDNFLAFLMLTFTVFIAILGIFAVLAGLFILASNSLLGFMLVLALAASALISGVCIYGSD